MADSDYWAALAQVIPLLALALVVVARDATKQWNVETPRGLRFTLTTIWAATLIILTFGELRAFRVLRGGVVSPLWPLLTELAIASGLGLLILWPVVEFAVKGNAEGIARVLTSAWVLRFRLAERSLFHWHRKFNEERHLRWLLLQETEATIGEFASTVAELRVLAAETNDPDRRKVVEEYLGKATVQLEDARRNQADGIRGYRQMITFELERERYLREDRLARRRDQSEQQHVAPCPDAIEAIANARKEAARWMLAFSSEDGLGRVGNPASQAAVVSADMGQPDEAIHGEVLELGQTFSLPQTSWCQPSSDFLVEEAHYGPDLEVVCDVLEEERVLVPT